MRWIRYLLFPVSPVYFMVTWCRNFLYNKGLLASKSYDFPLICVGNLNTGGTGKTPMIEYLIRFFKDKKNTATLSRGYKRQTKGFVLANNNVTAKSLGDEPYQLYKKFEGEILVAVDADRQNGIKRLIQKKCELILLDDAYQHRKIRAGLNILLTAFDKLYVNDMVLPAGNLREPVSGAKRANIIVVTKCPTNLPNAVKSSVIAKLKPKPYQKVFFSTISYANKVYAKHHTVKLKELTKFCLVTGIADAKPLINFLKSKELQFEHLNYPDHYDFKQADVDKLNTKQFIVTTEKDYVRLNVYKSLQEKLYYIPIKISLANKKRFNKLLIPFTI